MALILLGDYKNIYLYANWNVAEERWIKRYNEVPMRWFGLVYR
jgi:hypothetical protein